MALARGMADIQQIYWDHVDKSGQMPKERVADAVRCNGQNPLNTEIRDIVKRFKGPSITLAQFQEVASLCERQNKSPKDELSESLSVFDVDGEGWVPMSHFKHLICSPESGEGLTPDQFDNLLSTVKTSEDGLVRIADIVHLLESL